MALHFLWVGNDDPMPLVLASKKSISKPKEHGGWGLKDITTFAHAPAAKNAWNLVEGTGIWHRIINEKYFTSTSIMDWIRSTNKSFQKGTIVWTALINSLYHWRWLI